MSRAQERGLAEVLDEAEGLAHVLRLMSGGKLDLVPVLTHRPMPPLEIGWEAAKTEAAMIAGGGGRG